VEREALGVGERLVTQEVVQRAPEPAGDELERANRRPDLAGLDLTDEALGELGPGDLALGEPGLAPGGADALTEGGGAA